MELKSFVEKYKGLADIPIVILDGKALSAGELLSLTIEKPFLAETAKRKVLELMERELSFEEYRFLAAKYLERKIEMEKFYPPEHKIIYAAFSIPPTFLTAEQAYLHVIRNTPTGKTIVENFKRLHREVVRRLREKAW
jgi:hypothetical protein